MSLLDIETQSDGTIKVTNPGLGTRVINSPLTLIEDQLAVLKHYASDGRAPSDHLLKDIRVYEFILNAEAPERMALIYIATKKEMITEIKNARAIKNYEVADRLNWDY